MPIPTQLIMAVKKKHTIDSESSYFKFVTINLERAFFLTGNSTFFFFNFITSSTVYYNSLCFLSISFLSWWSCFHHEEGWTIRREVPLIFTPKYVPFLDLYPYVLPVITIDELFMSLPEDKFPSFPHYTSFPSIYKDMAIEFSTSNIFSIYLFTESTGSS